VAPHALAVAPGGDVTFTSPGLFNMENH
jgi:hypothetical protein